MLEHEIQEEWREITDKGMNRELQVSVVCWSSQQLTNKPFLCGVHPGFLQRRAHTYTNAITDVTRIQGVLLLIIS